MYFKGILSIIINGKALTKVVSVKRINDLHDLGATCDIIIPLNATLEYVNTATGFLTSQTAKAQNLISNGDSVLVQAYYEGYAVQTIFTGFVVSLVLGNQVIIKCQDYQYFFNLGLFGENRGALVKINKKKTSPVIATFGCHYASITLVDLLNNLIGFVNDTIDVKCTDTDHVTLYPGTPGIDLVNITFSMMTPAAILQYFVKELGLVITMMGTQLYCNIATNQTAQIKYDTTRNIISSDMQKPSNVFQSYKVKAWFYKPDGTKDSIEVGDENGQLRDFYFYNVAQNLTTYTNLATQALTKVKQMTYGGSIETLLYPQPLLGATAIYNDFRFPEKNGNYSIQRIETDINADAGYKHTLKLSWQQIN
jgi:hypothetical protein